VRSYFLYFKNISLKCSQGSIQISINQTRFSQKEEEEEEEEGRSMCNVDHFLLQLFILFYIQ
jgi:hypothetical protein